MRIDRRLILLIFLFPFAPASSQVAQQARYEIPIYDAYSKPYGLISLNEQGILIYGSVIADGIEAVEVIRIDTAFNEVWKGFIKLEKHSIVLMAQATEGKALILLKDKFAI